VATPNGALADGRSTAIMVMGVREGMRLARRTQGVEVFLVRKDGRRLHSPGFPLCVLA
jgi:thiamine biosynthesis lipoprotein ApbE